MKLVVQPLTIPSQFSIAPEAKQTQGEMVRRAQEVMVVTCATEQAVAAAVGSELQKHIKAVKEARLALARPLNEACDKLIALQNAYLAPLETEKDRLGRLVTDFQQAEARRVAEAEAARQVELDRLEEERREAEAKAQTAPSEAAAMQADMEAYLIAQAQEEAIRAPLPEPPVKAKGAATKKKLCYQVTDIKALYAARPELCDLKEKPSAILAVCSATDVIPGLKLWEEEKTSFR